MNKSLKVKLGLIVVLIIVYLALVTIAFQGFSREVQFLEKSPRNVVMIDAWSFNNGSGREGYEGRFIDDKTKIEFTYRIDSWGYQSYKKNPVPTSGVLNISDNTLGINEKGWVKYFLAIMLLTLGMSAGIVITAISLRFQRGFAHELRCYLRGDNP